MRHLRIIVFGTATLGFALSAALPAGEARTVAVPPEAEEAGEPAPTLPGFSGDQLRRLRELRAWLERRKLQRQEGGVIEPGRKPPRELTVYSDRQLLTPLGQRYALGFQGRRNESNRESPILHIGRGSDGRIRHRYVFRGPERSEPGDLSPAEPADPRQPPAAGSGTAKSRQRIVRLWEPEPIDRRTTAPRLEYELPDQRR